MSDDAAAADEARASRSRSLLRVLLPIAVLALGVAGLGPGRAPQRASRPTSCRGPGWCCRRWSPTGPMLSASLLVTLDDHAQGLLLAVVGGVGLAVLFTQSRLVEHSLYPFAVILQVTPIVAIAPLMLIYLPQQAAVLICAWIVAFFPVLSNTTLGLNSVDHNLATCSSSTARRAGRCCWHLQAAGGAALLPRRAEDRRRAVADRRGGRRDSPPAPPAPARASPTASSSPATGSTSRACSRRCCCSRSTGIVIFFALSLVSHLVLRRWHESAVKQEV